MCVAVAVLVFSFKKCSWIFVSCFQTFMLILQLHCALWGGCVSQCGGQHNAGKAEDKGTRL